MHCNRYEAAIDICSVPLDSLQILVEECKRACTAPPLDFNGCYVRVTGFRSPYLFIACTHKDYLEDFLRRYNQKAPHESVSEMISLTKI